LAALSATVLAVSIPWIALSHIEAGNRAAAVREAGSGDLLPERFGGWTKHTTATSWNPAPRTEMPYALARYARGDQEIDVFVAATERQMDKVTGYAIDLVGPGEWFEAKRYPLSNCSSPACDQICALELARKFSDDVRHIYYAYALGGRMIGSALELQLQRAWSRFVGAHSTARVVAIASNSKSELSAEDVVKALSAIVTSEPHS
jgi:EpsI family protein